MRYIKGGVEIQYRECQIMREAAKPFATGTAGYLLANENQWMDKIKAQTNEHPIKQTLIPPMLNILAQMDDERKTAVAEYVEYLVKKGRGIDILVPFTATNSFTILPVNVHETMDGEQERKG